MLVTASPEGMADTVLTSTPAAPASCWHALRTQWTSHSGTWVSPWASPSSRQSMTGVCGGGELGQELPWWQPAQGSGQCARALHDIPGLDAPVLQHPGSRNAYVFHAQHSDKPPGAVPTGFVVLPGRWIVERAHAWTERCRYLVMHYDRKLSTSTAWVWLAEAQALVSRPAAYG